MSRRSLFFRTSLPTSLLLLTATLPAYANKFSGPLSKSEWAPGVTVPSYIDMFIAVPDNMPAKPPILVNIHSCDNNANGQWSSTYFAPLRDAIDSVGYIMILPEQRRNCWNVGAPESLTHDGGGDTGAIVQMVKYALAKYNGDPTRVYVMGGSGGGMATQALLAVYPEVFKGGHARAGVPAGCWAVDYVDMQDKENRQWSTPCAQGYVDKTPMEWGDLVRAINPGFTGPRPRVQINQGDQDGTISFKNYQEGIDEWTNVLGLDSTPTRTDTNFVGAAATYNRNFWDDACGYTVLETWQALGQGHSMGYESEHILEFFGLDQVREKDPWDEACGDFTGAGGGSGTGGAGGTGGADGSGAAAATGGAGSGVGGGGAAGVGGASVGTGGETMGSGGSVITPATGGTTAGIGGAPAGTGGAVAAPASGGVGAGVGGAGAAVGAGAAGSGGSGTSGGGCSLLASPMTGGAFPFALLGLGLALQRRRRSAR